MIFSSDNYSPVPQQVMDALAEANKGYQPSYGEDSQMKKVRHLMQTIFEAPDAAVYLVATGTAANSLALSTLCEPWQTIFCSPVSHIHEDECNAPEFFSGAKLTLVGDSDKINPTELRKSIQAEESRGVHGPQRGPVSITQITEKGQVYTLSEINEITRIAREFKLPVHMDGARFANALVSLDCTAAEMTWKSGIDVVSFGGTKNGLMGVEGVIFFDPQKAWEFELRRKRAAHLFSKHRYLSAQMLAYLENDLWIELASKANKAASLLIEGLRNIEKVDFLVEPKANLIFVTMPAYMHRKAFEKGLEYYTWSEIEGVSDDTPVVSRFVVDWSRSLSDIDKFLEIMRNAAKKEI